MESTLSKDYKDLPIAVAPYAVGLASRGNRIIRPGDGGQYLSLNQAEFAVLETLRQNPCTFSEFVSRHLAGDSGLDIRGAVQLLGKLLGIGLLRAGDTGQDHSFTSELMKLVRTPTSIWGTIWQRITGVFNFSIIRFDDVEIPSLLSLAGRLVSQIYVMATLGLLLPLLLIYRGLSILPDTSSYFYLFHEPERLLLEFFPIFSITSSLLALGHLAVMKGLGCRRIPGAVKLTGLVVLRLRVDSDDLLMCDRNTFLRAKVFELASPWIMALISWQFMANESPTSLPGLCVLAFILQGLVQICPLYRSPLIGLAEGLTGHLDIFARGSRFLTKGIFRNIVRFDRDEESDEALLLDKFVVFNASWAMVWLYVLGCMFASALIGMVPDLLAFATSPGTGLRQPAAIALLGVMLAGFIYPVIRLIVIPFQNLLEMAEAPIRKIRSGLRAGRGGQYTGAEVRSWLQQLPVFAGLDQAQIEDLGHSLRPARYAKGMNIILAGEEGTDFYLLVEGQAQVVLDRDGAGEVVEVLYPGDSFGEVALLEGGRRTATVRALTGARTLKLDQEQFNQLFPPGSAARDHCTRVIRDTKLILESQALSHLTPREIRELTMHLKHREFRQGDTLVRKGDEAGEVFLVSAGELEIRSDSKVLATVGRGALIGSMAALDQGQRMADIRALSDGRCLVMERDVFVGMCRRNIYVAMLIARLHKEQQQDNRRAAA